MPEKNFLLLKYNIVPLYFVENVIKNLFTEDGLWNLMAEISDVKIHFQNLTRCLSIPSDKCDQDSMITFSIR